MSNYSNSSIYKLCCNDASITDIYIGSTTNFRRRKFTHKSSCHNSKSQNYNQNVYQFIRENGGFNAFDMIEIERCNATDKRNLETRERYWIELLKPTLNRQIPTRTHQQYYVDNQEERLLKSANYREKNKGILGEKFKVWYEENKEAMLNKRKQVRNENKAIGKSIYQEKKAHKKTRINCIHCGSTTTYQSKSRHEKTNKCIYNQIYNFIHS